MRPNNDPFAPLLTHFSARARLFYSGNLCSHVHFDAADRVGYLHLLRSGQTRLHDAAGHTASLSEPCLIFYSRPLTHWFDPDPVTGADLVCATVAFDNSAFNPVAQALPARFECALQELAGPRTLLDVLFEEAAHAHPGRQEVLNRLFEAVLIMVMRTSVQRGKDAAGFLRGLAHPQLGKVLAALHARPGDDWSLESMANIAGMSRSNFAATFRREVSETPGDYLTRWRMAIAQSLLRRGRPLKLVAGEVGYASQPGFLRAFRLVVGMSPKQWLRSSADVGMAPPD